MIDLDELERKEQEATPEPWYPLVGHPYLFANMRGPEPWHHDIIGRFDYNSEKDRAFIAALRNAAPELIAMARRLEWIVSQAVEWDEVEHKAFLIELQTLRGHDVYAAIDAAMQEQKT